MSTETTETTTSTRGADWTRMVTKGKTLLGRRDKAAWELGDLASSVVAKYAEGDLKDFAAAIGVEYNTVRAWRRVAEAFPVDSRLSSWTVAQVLAGQPDRIDLVSENPGMTKAEAVALVKARKQATQDAAIPTQPEPTGNGAEGAAGAARADEGTPAPEPTYEDSTGDLIARLLGATHSDRWEAFAAVLRESMPEEITTLINRLMMAQPWPVEATPAPAKPAPRKRSRKAGSIKLLSPSDADALRVAAEVVNDAAERELAEAA